MKKFARRLNRILCALFILAVAPVSQAADAPDSKAIEGNWIPVKAELGGQALGEDVLKTISMKLHDGKYEVLVSGHPDIGNYTIDSSTKPKSITVNGTEGPNRGKTFPAIYEVGGETLRICYDLSGKQRPAEFKTLADTKLYLVTYNRKKD